MSVSTAADSNDPSPEAALQQTYSFHLPTYRSFDIGRGTSEETANKWKMWKRGLELYTVALGIDIMKEKTRLKSMVLHLLGEECLDIYDSGR